MILKKKNPSDWSEEQGLILFRGKVYVPLNIQLRTEIVQLHHDTLQTGHPGRWRTYELVTRNYWWPGISIFIQKYVSGCDLCQRTKIFPSLSPGKLVLDTLPT